MSRPALREEVNPAGAIRRNSSYDSRKENILRAAATVFAERGFEGASVREVATRAGIGLSGLYYYFQSKEALLFAIQSNVFSTLVQSLKERIEKLDDSERRLHAVIENHLEYSISNAEELKICVHELESLSGVYFLEVLRLRREYYALVKSIVAGVSGNNEHSLSTLYLFGALNWIHMWYDTKEHGALSAVARHFTELFLSGAPHIGASGKAG